MPRRFRGPRFVPLSFLLTSLALAAAPGNAQEAATSRDLVVTEVPDACELLTREDASELLGDEVGEGERYDVAGFPCVYRSASGRRLVLVAHLGRDAALDGTQPAMELEYCGAERVRSFDDLGVEAALFRSTGDEAGCGETLWVSTGVGFRGKIHPDQFQEVERRLHFVLTLEPAADESERVGILAQAAKRALTRLRSLAKGG